MDNWKDLFRPHILERGWNYYVEGAVQEIKPTPNGVQAVVEGTEDYDVEIEISDGEVHDMWCSCPYAEDGNYCKHMAAVLYEMEDSDKDGERSGGSALSWEERYRQSQQELSEVISHISEEEVRRLLLELALEDEKLQNRILTQYTDMISERQMLRLKKEIDNIAYENSDRSGFIDWRNAYGYVQAMEDFLYSNVQALIDKGCTMQAFELTNAVFIRVANEDIDDSEGGITELADTCYEFWKKILDHCKETEKEQIFRWFEKHQSDGTVVDYMEDYICDFLMNEFHDQELLKKKLAMLDELIEEEEDNGDSENPWGLHYRYENNILKRLEIMKELGYPEEEIQKYKEKNWRLAAVRKLQLIEYLEAGDNAAAIRLLTESKELDKSLPGLVAEYSEKLISLYQREGMKQEYKKELIFQVLNCRQGDLKFAEKLKKACTEKEWEDYREKILTANSGWQIRYKLLEKEGMYERLFQERISSGSIYSLDQYEKILMKRFPEDMRDAYVGYVKNQAGHVADRKKYKELIQYLKKIKKYPDGSRIANEIAGEWRQCYYRRPAMMDELRKAGF